MNEKSENYWLKINYDLLYGMYFSELISGPNYDIYICDIIKDKDWNYANIYSNYGLSDFHKLINNIEEIFFKKERNSSVYLNQSNIRFEECISKLIKAGYENFFHESFMILEDVPSMSQKRDMVTVERLTSSQHEIDFITVFTLAYEEEISADNPNGSGNDDYIRALKRSFNMTNKYYQFILYFKNKPVAVGSLGYSNGYGGIYNIGTVPEFRGQGFGTIITMACIEQWKNLGGKTLFLQTETGSIGEKLYNKLGFKTLFTGIIYSKNSY